ASTTLNAPVSTAVGPMVGGTVCDRGLSIGRMFAMARPSPLPPVRPKGCSQRALCYSRLAQRGDPIASLVIMKHKLTQASSGALGSAMPATKAEPQVKELRKQAGNWLKELRGQAGLSQVDLARILGFKYYTFISQVENGFG